MSVLTEMKCEACQIDAPKVNNSDMVELMLQLPEWTVIKLQGVSQLERVYKFKNFKLAWSFTNAVAELAEEEFHHPEITLEWGKVTVRWWSHSVKGLHKNDFICASKTDSLI
ncbi:MAG: 4a-hydroxytetrahydrobiopterin dehydratase [Aliivibrio sp.]|uniref:4a-hydroxytetrahydrobiopterin dehydratase n=1 Tax=Aliivibrio sp. TaxID=1872443 RepID=UPI001A58E91A|nr:4a-hydroxytetrahydrobiopterin dehydratase [Aliivibrio sp.]